MKLSLVIPARNEEGHIGSTVRGLVEVLDEAEVEGFEILVVDDGSTDETREIVEEIGRQDPRVRLVRNRGPHGFGRAVRCGLNHYTGDAVIITMGDASDAPADVLRYYELLRDRAECAFGSRFVKGAQLVDYPLLKLLLNRLVNNVIRLVFGLRYNDVTNAFKGYRRNVIEGCSPLVSPHFNLTVELPLKAVVRGYTHAVVPISWTNRSSGESHLVLKEQGSRYLFSVLSVWFEWLLVRRDYRRPGSESFHPWNEARERENGEAQ